MRLVVIEAESKTYTVYEDRKMLAQYSVDFLLTADHVEELRTMPELPEVA